MDAYRVPQKQYLVIADECKKLVIANAKNELLREQQTAEKQFPRVLSKFSKRIKKFASKGKTAYRFDSSDVWFVYWSRPLLNLLKQSFIELGFRAEHDGNSLLVSWSDK
jgi:hypothetical protein